MADRRAEIDQRAPLLRRVPGIHRIDADLQFERRRDPVAGLVSTALRILAMGVEIDEAGRHDQPRGVEGLARGRRRSGDLDDDASADRDVADGIEPALGVHHPAAGDQQIEPVRVGSGSAGACQTNHRRQRQHAERLTVHHDRHRVTRWAHRRKAVPQDYQNPSIRHHSIPTVSTIARFATDA